MNALFIFPDPPIHRTPWFKSTASPPFEPNRWIITSPQHGLHQYLRTHSGSFRLPLFTPHSHSFSASPSTIPILLPLPPPPVPFDTPFPPMGHPHNTAQYPQSNFPRYPKNNIPPITKRAPAPVTKTAPASPLKQHPPRLPPQHPGARSRSARTAGSKPA